MHLCEVRTATSQWSNASPTLAASAAITLLFSTPTAVTAQDNRAAYDVALRCLVANGRADGVEQRAGNQAAASRYQASARQSFDAMVALGVALGKSRAQMDADIAESVARDLPRMVNDRAYYRSVIGSCRAYGLMPPA